MLLLAGAAWEQEQGQGQGQGQPRVLTPPAPARGAVAGDLNVQVQQLADRVRHLGERVEAELGSTPAGPLLLQDTRELAQGVDEYRTALRTAPDALRRRQLYSGIDASWHHLVARLGKPGASTADVDAAARDVGAADAAIHQALGLNAYPAVYYGSRSSPGGMPEVQRLARALVDRAEALLAAVQAEVPAPAGTRLAAEATALVQAADIFHDRIDPGTRLNEDTAREFTRVVSASDLLAADVSRLPASPRSRVRAAWQSFRTTEALLRQLLKLPAPQAELDAAPRVVEDRGAVRPLVDRLIAQADEFLIVFTPEARFVLEGGYFIADVRRLRGAAAAFRAAIPRVVDVGELALGFQEIDALWEVLARRTNRIAQGRGSSNIQRIEGIGQTVAELHRLLGMPGLPAEVGPFAQ
jgi:hypothetical protein